jgi:sulfonate transport system ATP-binding protein
LAALELRDLRKVYNLGEQTVAAVDGVTLSCRSGTFVALVGCSGCGKTTLLRTIAGFESVTAGEVRLGEGDGTTRTAMMFQEPRLMPWLTVRENIGFGLGRRLKQNAARLSELLGLLGLAEFADALPGQISGGMAQRTALGRALCLDPDLLLMDEPFGALDALTRRILQRELVNIWRASDRRRTILFVTHDMEEAVLLAERVLVMEQGRVIDDIVVPQAYPRHPEDIELIRLRERLIARLGTTESLKPKERMLS